jgi:hypothetical protein
MRPHFCIIISFSAAQGIAQFFPSLSKIQQASIGVGIAGVVTIVVFCIFTLSLLVMMSRRYRNQGQECTTDDPDYQVDGFRHTMIEYVHEDQPGYEVEPEYNIQPEYRLGISENEPLEDKPSFKLEDVAGFSAYNQPKGEQQDNQSDE